MKKFGMRIARPGNSVDSGPYQKLYDSEIPTLLTVIEGVATMNDGYRKHVVPHNLGFAPWVIVYTVRPDFAVGDPSAVSWPRYWSFGDVSVISDSKNVTIDFTNAVFFPFSYQKFHYFITNYPISTNFLSPATRSIEDPGGQDFSEGIKALRTNHDLKSNDLRNFSMHPAGKQLTVYASKFGHGALGTHYSTFLDGSADSANDFTLAIEHNLGYPPIALSAMAQSGTNLGDDIWQQANYAYSNNKAVFTTNSTDRPFALLVLTEPVAPTDVTIQQVAYNG